MKTFTVAEYRGFVLLSRQQMVETEFGLYRYFMINAPSSIQNKYSYSLILHLHRFRSIILLFCFCCGIVRETNAQGQQSYRLIETVSIPQKIGFQYAPTSRPFSIAIDEIQGRAFVSSLEDSQFPIIDLDSVRHAGFLPMPISPQGIGFQMLTNPAKNLVYLYPSSDDEDTVKTLFAINTLTKQRVTTGTYQYSIKDIALHRALNLLFVADKSIIRILNASTLQQEDSISPGFVIGGIALDSTHQRLFVSAKDLHWYQMRLASYSLTKPYTPLKTLSIPMPIPMSKIFLDSSWNRMILVGETHARVLQLGTTVVMKHLAFNNRYPFALYSPSTERLLVANTDGYGASGEGGNFGKILALGCVKDTRDSGRLGMNVTGIALDERRACVVAVSSQQASVQVYNLANLRPADKYAVDLGYMFDDMALASEGGGIIVTNRYGSSNRLISYNFGEPDISWLPTGTWTTSLAIDSARGRMFALAQQENMIYLYSSITNAFLGKVPIFGYKEMRTNALAGITLDKARQKLYVTMPEHKTVASIDLSSAATDRALKVLGYSFADEEAANGGLQTVYVPEANKLYILRTAQRQLNVYNLNNFTLVDSISLGTKWTVPMQSWTERMLHYDPTSKFVFAGSIAIDVTKNRIESHSLAGASRFLGYNAKQTSLFGISKSGSSIMLHEFNPQTFAPLASRVLFTSNEEFSPIVQFDSRRNQLCALERKSGLFRRFDVNTLVPAVAVKTDTALTTLSIYPNPVVNQAIVRFGVRTKEKVKLTVLDSQGREVAILTETDYEPGTHTITLKVEGDKYSSQTYFVQLKSPTMYYNKPIQVQRQ